MEYHSEMCQFHRTANLITSYAISNSKFVQISLRNSENSEILSSIDRAQLRYDNFDWKNQKVKCKMKNFNR